jgi:hypothetical protein
VIGVVIVSIVIVGVIMLAMAVGMLGSRNRCLRGSCGGLQSNVLEARGLSCETCPLRRKADDNADDRLAERA